MEDSDFRLQLAGYGLATWQIHYYMPDHPSLLQNSSCSATTSHPGSRN
jgi:uncharacterized protein Usg